MSNGRRSKIIVDVRSDERGVNTAYRFEGNSTFTPKATALRMAERDEIDKTHIVDRKGAEPFLRSNPNRSRVDNHDQMAGDKPKTRR